MKKSILMAALIGLTISCSLPPKSNSDSNKTSVATALNQDFDWLIGNWIRTNEQENKTTFENWEKKNQREYAGFSYTMQSKDTIWQETIQLIKTDGDWSYNVTGKGESEPTKFRLTEIGKRKFTCENQANEFPQKIEYSLREANLHARISGGDMEMLFNFEKTN